MNASFNAYLSVKFRAFGITFGTVTQSFSVTINGIAISWSLTNALPTSAAKTLYNNRGVLFQLWV